MVSFFLRPFAYVVEHPSGRYAAAGNVDVRTPRIAIQEVCRIALQDIRMAPALRARILSEATITVWDGDGSKENPSLIREPLTPSGSPAHQHTLLAA